MSSDASHATAKICQDHPSNLSDEHPLKRPCVQLRVGPDPHRTPALSSSEHLASRARQECCGIGTSFSASAAPGLLLCAEPVASCPTAAPAHLPIPDGLIAMDPGQVLPSLLFLRRQVRSTLGEASAAKIYSNAPKRGHAEPKRYRCSLDALDATSHKIRLRLMAEECADKGTNDAYACHIHNYVAYWDQYQAEMVANNPTWTSVPALPISTAKWKLGSSDTIPGSNVGKSVIQQAISALEDWRMSHHHLYLGVPEAQVRLRDDNRIQKIESAAKHNELKRAESSQVLKASGTTSDAYTTEELTKCSGWCLSKFSGTFCIDDIQLGYTVLPVPAFAPEFSKAGYGEFGHQSWYNLYVFWGERPDKQMSYNNHYDHVKLIHSKNDISLTKATHATRHFTAKTACSHRASGNDVKAIGCWSVNDAFANCYDSMFNARKPEQYILAQDHLEPPSELLLQIFPWIEQENAALQQWEATLGRAGCDIALKGFL
ncbi:uncharacterized protein F5891DRAFT_974358 [Suillus fuscotomentosus]|uniref:Uncharacterized protein n=1 Tax=Suillus fuscotomentosus TaxID=1912939 RepID=A0AAD4HUL8_9AGAM|nr:uncharacterized protein F5891DRAFT_974358 [Suillus fuscotomentosus]KAG1907694.1 hypothetical protein F5891DRAFT_974358 [Suillus fuscotomentosus]